MVAIAGRDISALWMLPATGRGTLNTLTIRALLLLPANPSATTI